MGDARSSHRDSKSEQSDQKYFLWKNQGKVADIHKKLSKSGKVRENEIVTANVLENVDIVHFISIFFQRIRVISVTFCYTADKLELGENILSQGKSGKIKT